MVTHSASHASHVGYEKENIPHIPATTTATKEHHTTFSGGLLLKWFGAISTVLLSVAAVAPGLFGIPANLKPWLFLVAIFWVLAFCAGMFDL